MSKNKITAKEYITTVNGFRACYTVELFRNGKNIKTVQSYGFCDFDTLKSDFRHKMRAFDRDSMRVNNLAIVDSFGNYYNYTHLGNFKNIADAFKAYRQLKNHLEEKPYQVIEKSTAQGVEYFTKTYKIVRLSN